MKRKVYCSLAVLLFIGLVTSVASPAPPVSQIRPTAKHSPLVAKEDWRTEWSKLLAAAQKEGKVVLCASSGPAIRDPLTKYFFEKFKVSIEWVSATNIQLKERIDRERRAGLFLTDVYFSGVSGILLGESKVLESLDNVLFLPEVLDKKAWWGGDLIFIDDEHTWAGILAYPVSPIFINTNMVKLEEVQSYKAFLEPKWKGKIVLFNPRTGGGLDWVYHVSEVIMGRDYLVALAKQEPVIVGDARQQVEWVARGKYPVALGGRGENKVEFVRLGAPVKLITPVEGASLTSSAGGVGLFNRAPHPNAAKLFINWALTKEGGTLISRLIGGQSARLDVPTDSLEPTMVRQAGMKYYNTINEKHTQRKQAFPKVATEIFGHLMK